MYKAKKVVLDYAPNVEFAEIATEQYLTSNFANPTYLKRIVLDNGVSTTLDLVSRLVLVDRINRLHRDREAKTSDNKEQSLRSHKKMWLLAPSLLCGDCKVIQCYRNIKASPVPSLLSQNLQVIRWLGDMTLKFKKCYLIFKVTSATLNVMRIGQSD